MEDKARKYGTENKVPKVKWNTVVLKSAHSAISANNVSDKFKTAFIEYMHRRRADAPMCVLYGPPV